ncbi:MAG: hypothetical protein WCV63_05700 [Negativicutes bacterium]|jgi:hypothetical protein
MTFADYCVEFGILSRELVDEGDGIAILVMWDRFGGDYIQYCTDHQLQYEDLSNCISEEEQTKKTAVFCDECFYETDS